jgi:predicted DNA-binding transcriptional regulator YafY
MARNAEMTRQWQVLRDIDAARTGITIPKLAAARGVCQRTIRRDIEALSLAGFPLYDDKVTGTTMWKLRARPFRGLEENGLSLTELCALYFSRAILAAQTGGAFQDDLERALEKVERALPVGCRKFLDSLPVAVKAKISGRKRPLDQKGRSIANRAAEAMLNHRKGAMRYDSVCSRRIKDYVVEPLRFTYAGGGLYLTAFVPEYGETRTFALERMLTFAILDESFQPRPLPTDPFPHSLGVNTAAPERVEIEFDSSVAGYVSGREWHQSQVIEARPDGSVMVVLNVCVDQPLKAWVLSFGAATRVVAPLRLAQAIATELDEGRRRYLLPASQQPAADEPEVRVQIPLPLMLLERAS